MRIILKTLLAGFALLIPALSAAQDFPTKPIKLIVPFPAGGPNDIIARVVGQRMSELTKQPVLIEGMKPIGDTPQHFRAFIGSEAEKWSKVIRDAGLAMAK